MTPKAIVYLRRSDAQQEKSLDQQLQWAVDMATHEKLGLNVTLPMLAQAQKSRASNIGDLYFDDAITGADLNRPGLKAFIDRAMTDSSVTHVMTFMFDRLARPEHPSDALKIVNKILLSGKWFVTSDRKMEPRLRSSERGSGDDHSMLATFHEARAFRVKLSKRVLGALAENAKAGFWSGGSAPFGFVRAFINVGTRTVVRLLADGEKVRMQGHKVAVLPCTFPACAKLLTAEELKRGKQALDVVGRIHDAYFHGLHGLKIIANRLNADQIPSPNA
ncbi:MAG: recombinase family protein, partial [Acidobacteriota bacterium]